ncbi:FHA domain-containing protein [Arthrobacter sp. YD4]|uniref:FHA domain-containing protein n=1 Tax=Arthrobacter sp. YD4 TaxID=3058043 RepID=UPI0025B550C2|nr:FHA domain-containing protein [Arthrobacter sp. YD4]MDN3937651.1 FHA domain-containing protein [Arthrobacter sp. YD4]
MGPRFRVDADLEFSVTEPSGGGTSGTVQAAGTEVKVTLSSLDSSLGQRMPSLQQLRPLAKTLAEQGLTVVIEGPQGLIASLGAVRTGRAQRLLTRSPHIRLGNVRTVAPLARRGGRTKDAGMSLLPPETPLPLLPTVKRRIVRKVTTTHHTRGSGRPRLIFVQDSATWDGQVPREFNLSGERMSIGSGPDADLRLDGLESIHAEIVHNERDEYVLVRHGVVTGSFGPADSSILRTGARLQMGPWCLAYFREEFADHGRPFGGRSGGEFAYQKPQLDPRTGLMEQDGSTGVT